MVSVRDGMPFEQYSAEMARIRKIEAGKIKALDVREARLKKREAAVGAREKAAKKQERALATRAMDLKAKTLDLDKREREILRSEAKVKRAQLPTDARVHELITASLAKQGIVPGSPQYLAAYQKAARSAMEQIRREAAA